MASQTAIDRSVLQPRNCIHPIRTHGGIGGEVVIPHAQFGRLQRQAQSLVALAQGALGGKRLVDIDDHAAPVFVAAIRRGARLRTQPDPVESLILRPQSAANLEWRARGDRLAPCLARARYVIGMYEAEQVVWR